MIPLFSVRTLWPAAAAAAAACDFDDFVDDY